jgi:hypothetical protein
MERGAAGIWKESGGRWAIEVEIDDAFCTERDYADAASASQAIAQILRQQANRSSPHLDEDPCGECAEPRPGTTLH